MDLVRPVLLRTGPKSGDKVLEIPGLNIIVLRVPSVDVTLDGVAVVAYHETRSQLTYPYIYS